MVAELKFKDEEDVYLKDAQNYTFPVLGGALTNNPHNINETDDGFEEALGDLPVVEGADFGLDTFGLVS